MGKESFGMSEAQEDNVTRVPKIERPSTLADFKSALSARYEQIRSMGGNAGEVKPSKRTFEIRGDDQSQAQGVTVNFYHDEDRIEGCAVEVPANAPEELQALNGKVFADMAEAQDAVTGIVSTLES